nr:hypothetical protein [Veillonella denticariosi]
MTSVAAKHAKGKKLKDVIFVTAGQAQADVKENGRENVINGTLGGPFMMKRENSYFSKL